MKVIPKPSTTETGLYNLVRLKHGSMSMKNKNQSPQLDLFTPIMEVFHELCMMTAKVTWELLKFAYRKLTNQAPPLEKVERKLLSVKKATKNEDALGVDTKTKKPILLKDIDFRRHSFIVGAT